MADILEVNANTGVIIERAFTDLELEQRNNDFEAEKERKRLVDLEEAAVINARNAAIAHARSLGFTNEMIKVLYPNLIVEENTEE